ncbi:MAG: hypothetical protein AB7U81_11495 [Thiohalomonadaceae bacterium]
MWAKAFPTAGAVSGTAFADHVGSYRGDRNVTELRNVTYASTQKMDFPVSPVVKAFSSPDKHEGSEDVTQIRNVTYDISPFNS